MHAVLAAAIAAILLVVYPLVGVCFGALSGWIVGLFFPETLSGIASILGLDGWPTWQLGAALGFVGGFFRAYQHSA